MKARVLPLVALALLPAVASAQRGGGGRDRGTKADFDGMISSSPVGLRLSNGDVEDMNPVKLLADKRKDLKLTDDQLKQIRAMNDALKESNKPQFKVLDSLRTAMRPRAGADEDVERVRTQLARQDVVDVVKAIRDGYDAKLKEAVALLDDTQKAKADELVARQARDSEEMLAKALGGGRGGMGGGRRGRPPAA
ncbi:MAG: Spy/CpxP family protein refolding chaperone [Gemmatimonadota bacterium]|nr:Spy/CpxP family protein refolding chaperone [Gemmatimonadota bacterium]